MRPLWVVARLPPLHTVGMAGDAFATTFITGADGFLGAALVKVLVGRGHRVLGLVASPEAGRRLRRAGAIPVVGDLGESGQWQDEAAADWVFHLPQHSAGRSPGSRRCGDTAPTRLRLDARLLDAVSAGTTRRLVYAADACCYGPTGARAITEDEPQRPSACGRDVMPALDRVDGYVVAGLPIITALPGLVYGNASWFRERVVEPIMAGRHVLQFGKTGRWVSPIHVQDCARALVHLAEHGEPGRRYFLVNRDPIRMHDFAATFAHLAHRPLRVWRLPEAAIRFLACARLADYMVADGVFSNIRLRGIGFRFHYPTLEQGVQQILGALHA